MSAGTRRFLRGDPRQALLAGCALAGIGAGLALLSLFLAWTPASASLRDSTPGELAIWIAAQSGEDAPASLLGRLARERAHAAGAEALPELLLLELARAALLTGAGLQLLLGGAATLAARRRASWLRPTLYASLAVSMLWLTLIPATPGESALPWAVSGSFALLLALAISPGAKSRTLGFVVLLSFLLLGHETLKSFAEGRGYRIATLPDAWNYETRPDLESALAALAGGELDILIVERNEVRHIMAPTPSDPDFDPTSSAWPDLRWLARFERRETRLGIFPLRPAMPGRLVPLARVGEEPAALGELSAMRIGAVAGGYADMKFLARERELVLLDMKILNDINLPHLQQIAEAFLQPARRNGPFLLLSILGAAARHTWGEALLGFLFGASLGFALGTIFTHFRALERGLLPFVVASQTVPILAIAPMVVIWLGAGPLSVAVISAYLTFFPVTINTLRGLRSPHPNALELMHSWAASRPQIMWKLRFPAALPYLFTALKISATASVIGAIIGELPSSIRSGLGRAILDFSSDYSAVSTPRLWAAILTAAAVGMLSFLLVSLAERLLLRSARRSV